MKPVLLLFFISAVYAVCPHDRSGLTLFSQNSAWMTPGATVTIPSGTNVLLDTNANVTSITVNGDLIFKNTNIQLSTGFILINAGGGLYIGSTDNGCAITSQITITLVGQRQPVSVSQMGSDPFDGTLLGSKGIAAATGSTISIVGAVPSTTWSRLLGTVNSGASQITVEGAVPWKVGDEIVIATTDFSETTAWYNGAPSSLWYLMGRGSPDQNEVRTVTGLSSSFGGATTISLDTPLAFTHWGAEYERAEVGLLTRNIVLQGDSSTSAYGGHIMVRKALAANIIGAELINFGQRGNLGRYPIHFHLTKDSYGLGYTVSSNTIRDGFQRCIVMHYSNGIMIQNNVAYNNTGHCYFLEDGSERGNTFDHNLGIKTAAVASENPLIVLPTDNMASMFWITNPNNTFTNNAAVEATFGYWFSMPSSPTGISAGDIPAGDAWVRPRNTPLKVFSNNVAHSNRRNGIHVDDMVVPGPLTTELAAFSPLQGPYTSDTQGWNTPNIQANFDGMLIYKNREHGVWARGGPFQWTNLVAADNLRAFNCPPEPSVLTDSLLIGETSNIGTPLAAELGRSRPDPWNNNALVKGWETYDNSGAQYVKSTTFVNFTSSNIRPAAAISGLECAPFLMMARDRSRNLTLINSNPTWNNECEYGDSGYGWSFFDVDGSLTGSPSWIVSNNSLMYDNTCIWKSEWNQYSCPPFKEGNFLQLSVNVDSSKAYGAEFGNMYGYDSGNRRNNTRFSVYPLGSDGSLLSGYHGVGATTYGSGGPQWFMSANFKPRRGYAIRFDQNKPTPPSMTMTINSCQPGDWVYLAIPYPASYFPLTISANQYGTTYPMTQVNTLAQLNNRGQYYYDTSSSNLYIRYDCISDSFQDNWGFTDRSGYEGWAITITSGCSSGTCDTPNSAAVAIPPVIQNMYPSEDEYIATLQSCQSTTGSTSGSGIAYFYFNPVTATMTYKVVHDLTNIVTRVTVNKGGVRQSGPVLFELAYFDAPITGSAVLTRQDWIDLLKGNLYIVVQTTQSTEHIRGQIACVGDCTLPPYGTTLDACSQASYGADSFPIFTDKWGTMAYPNANGNAGDKYNTTIAISSDIKLCGNASLAATIGNAAFGVYVPNGGLNISTTVQSYMQFWARLADGQRTETFRIQFLSTADGNPIINPTDATNLIPSQYIDNLAISDEGWTRVRVPMSYFNFVNPMPKAYYFFVTRKSWNPQQDAVTLYIDEFRFTGAIQDQTTQGVATSDIYHPTAICISAPPSGGAISAGGTGTSSQSSSNGGGSSGKTTSGDALGPDTGSASSIIVSYAVIAIAIFASFM